MLFRVTKHASNLQSVDSVSLRLRTACYAATSRQLWVNDNSSASKDVSNWQATQNQAFKAHFSPGGNLKRNITCKATKRHSVFAKASPRQVASDGQRPGLIHALPWTRLRLAGGVLCVITTLTRFRTACPHYMSMRLLDERLRLVMLYRDQRAAQHSLSKSDKIRWIARSNATVSDFSSIYAAILIKWSFSVRAMWRADLPLKMRLG